MTDITNWLIIGAGGVGSKIAARIEAAFVGQNLDPIVQALFIDADTNDLSQLEPRQAINISRPEAIHTLLGRLPETHYARIAVEQLFDTELTSAVSSDLSLMEGPAAIYELGCLAFEVAREQVVNRISQSLEDFDEEQVGIVVVGSLCGTTSAALLPRLSECIRDASSTPHIVKRLIGLGLSWTCFRHAGMLPVNSLEYMERNEVRALRDLSAAPNHFYKFLQIDGLHEDPRSMDHYLGIAQDMISSEIEPDAFARASSNAASILIDKEDFIAEIPELRDGFDKAGFDEGQGAKDRSVKQSSPGIGATPDVDSNVPKALRPKIAKLRSVLSERPSEFAQHIENTIQSLQGALAEEIPKKPNDPIALGEWELLVRTLELSRNTLSVLHPLILDLKDQDMSEAKVSSLHRAFEKAIKALRDGCAYLDRETTGDGHYAKLHKVGLCVALGGIFAIPSGAPMIAAAAGVGAMFYGKDFAKSVFGIFASGKHE